MAKALDTSLPFKEELHYASLRMVSSKNVDRYLPLLTAGSDSSGEWSADLLYTALASAIRGDQAEYGGQAIVSQRQLAAALGVDRSLVHRVYERLRSAGLLVRPEGGRRYFLRGGVEAIKTLYPVIGIVLPVRFSEYIALTEARQRRQSIYDGIVDRATELDFATIPLRLPAPDTSDEGIHRYISEIIPRLSGVIHLGDRAMEEDRPLVRMWERHDIPQVCVACRTEIGEIGSVAYDTEAAVNSVSHYLKEFGHKNLGIVFQRQRRDRAICRYDMDHAGELAEMFCGAGMRTSGDWIFGGIPWQPGNFRKELEEALTEWFRQMVAKDEYPTAFWCRGDAVALMLLRIIQDNGYRVPEDFSIIGMDDTREAESSTPPLTTLRQPNYDNGVYAVNMLDEMLRGGNAYERKLPMTLVARKTVGPSRLTSHLSLSYEVY